MSRSVTDTMLQFWDIDVDRHMEVFQTLLVGALPTYPSNLFVRSVTAESNLQAHGTTTQKGIRKLHVLHLRREQQGQESERHPA